ncbi:thioesterase II family protein [Micromonospora coerulea]|uniref:thioesterase II family protein n=1 Tax=Micromonospora coerulea TaxID=47856 RepID=UPI0019068B6F|nr:alpha/beta fold hydrolase [Micromonospora veneta]
MTSTARNPWLFLPPNAHNDAFRLYCFPYAGAGAQIYRRWTGLLGERGRVVPVTLPGRESRFREPAYTDLRSLVDSLAGGVSAELDRPYALFGHSMGALIAFELAAVIAERGLPLPEVLFVSGHQPPHLPSDLSDFDPTTVASARSSMRRLGVLGPDLADGSDVLAEVMLPTLSADISLCASYTLPAPKPLPVDIVALGGNADPSAGPAAISAWSAYTTRDFACRFFDGDHFFISSNFEEVATLVSAWIDSRPPRSATTTTGRTR